MKTKLPQEMTMQELDDIIFLVVKANYPNMRDEGVERIIDHFNIGLQCVKVCSDSWER